MRMMRWLARRAPLYNKQECERLRAAGRFNAQLMDSIRPFVRVGVTTEEIDQRVHDYTVDHGHTPACLGYSGYPKTVCTSVNHVVCHGIPDETRLKSGDIVNVDLTTIVNGWHGDQSEMFLIGDVPDEARRLVQVTFDSLFAGIRAVQPYGSVIDIGRAIYSYAKPRGFEVVRQYQGHGIGRTFHQDPGVPHYPHPTAARDILEPGICFTIEPILNAGTWETELDAEDGWTVRTKDGRLSAQFEHTILMTEEGPEILTVTQNGPQPGHVF